MANENKSTSATTTGEALRARRAELLRKYEAAKVEVAFPNGDDSRYLEEFNATLKREANEQPRIDENTPFYLESLFAITAAKRIVEEIKSEKRTFGFVKVRESYIDAFSKAMLRVDEILILNPITIFQLMDYEELEDVQRALFFIQCQLLDILDDTVSSQFAMVGDYIVPASQLIPIIGGKDCTLKNNGLEIEVLFNPYEILEATEIKSKICSFYEAIKRTVADNA